MNDNLKTQASQLSFNHFTSTRPPNINNGNSKSNSHRDRERHIRGGNVYRDPRMGSYDESEESDSSSETSELKGTSS